MGPASDGPDGSPSPAPPPNDPWIGQELASYTILERLGEGGMGVLYLAKHGPLNRLAALKFLAPHLVNDPAYIELFLREARTAAQLNHPNMVTIYDAGQKGEDVYYLAMEYVWGQDLDSLRVAYGPIPPKDAAGFVRQASTALAYAHRKRLIHRDIKPDNLMLTMDGVVKVTDLGLAKWMGQEAGMLSRDGCVIGNSHFICPEIIKGSKSIDGRADIFSLGMTLYCLAAGRTPFDGPPMIVMVKQLNEQPPDPREFNPDLDEQISGIIMKMVEKEPENRFQTMEEIEAALTDYEKTKQPGTKLKTEFTTHIQKCLTEKIEKTRAIASTSVKRSLPAEIPAPSDQPPRKPLIDLVLLRTAAYVSIVVLVCWLIWGRTPTQSVQDAIPTSSHHQPAVETPLPSAAEIRIPTEASSPPAPPTNVEQEPDSPTPTFTQQTVPPQTPEAPTMTYTPSGSLLLADYDSVSPPFTIVGKPPSDGSRTDLKVVPGVGTDNSSALQLEFVLPAGVDTVQTTAAFLPVDLARFVGLEFLIRGKASQPIDVALQVSSMLKSSTGTARFHQEFAAHTTRNLGSKWKKVDMALQKLNSPPSTAYVPEQMFLRLEVRRNRSGSEKIEGTVLMENVFAFGHSQSTDATSSSTPTLPAASQPSKTPATPPSTPSPWEYANFDDLNPELVQASHVMPRYVTKPTRDPAAGYLGSTAWRMDFNVPAGSDAPVIRIPILQPELNNYPYWILMVRADSKPPVQLDFALLDSSRIDQEFFHGLPRARTPLAAGPTWKVVTISAEDTIRSDLPTPTQRELVFSISAKNNRAFKGTLWVDNIALAQKASEAADVARKMEMAISSLR